MISFQAVVQSPLQTGKTKLSNSNYKTIVLRTYRNGRISQYSITKKQTTVLQGIPIHRQHPGTKFVTVSKIFPCYT